MESLLSQFLGEFLFVFLLVFVRFGTAMIIMPGIGDTFVSPQVRLLFALALSFVIAPALGDVIPPPPPSLFMLLLIIIKEAIIGFFIGLVARIMMSALSVAGMVISMQSGLASAMVFNPTMAGQGSIIGSFFSVTAVALLFATNLHHLMIMAVYNSYDLFTFGALNSIGDLADVMARLVNDAFRIGFQFATPFIVISLMMYLALGILARLMPQLQVFFIALPLQILVSMFVLMVTLTVGMQYWMGEFEDRLIQILAY